MSKEITIKNNFVQATISSHAAEVISFRKASSTVETIWSRNPQHWRNCNPLLFPYAGPLKDGKYTYDGKEYSCGQHGFARDAEFTFTEVRDDEVALVLQSDFNTMRVYPFLFSVEARYKLQGHKLLIKYTVTNRDEKMLPFMIGLHPAFNCPMDRRESYKNYRIEFEQNEDLSHPERNIPDGNSFSLRDVSLFPSFFYHNHQLKSSWAQLTNGRHTVRVGIEGYASIGFWHSSDKAPFVCIEPWFPDNDLPKENTFRDDTENNLLPPGQVFECGYYFELI